MLEGSLASKALAERYQSYSDTDQGYAGPAGWADLFAEDVLCGESAEDVRIEGGSWDYKTDRLPGKEQEEQIERCGQEGDTHPEPDVGEGAAEEGQDFARTKASGFSDDLHAPGDEDFAPGAAEDEEGKEGEAAHHVAA